jgi:hypothetical protein
MDPVGGEQDGSDCTAAPQHRRTATDRLTEGTIDMPTLANLQRPDAVAAVLIAAMPPCARTEPIIEPDSMWLAERVVHLLKLRAIQQGSPLAREVFERHSLEFVNKLLDNATRYTVTLHEARTGETYGPRVG